MPMGRHRKRDKHLPALVSLERGTYYFRSGKSPRVNLGRDFADAMRRYGALVAPAPMATMVGVIDRYKREQLPSKAERTQAEYRVILDELRTVFGKMNPNAITANMVKQFRDGSLEKPRGDVQANLARAVFGTVMAWAISSAPCLSGRASVVRRSSQTITARGCRLAT